jgi:hypothetical protein
VNIFLEDIEEILADVIMDEIEKFEAKLLR